MTQIADHTLLIPKTRAERLLARLPADRLILRLLLESFDEHRWRYFSAVIAMVMVASTTALSAWIIGVIVDVMATPENRAKIYMVALGVVLIFMFKGIATFAQSVLMARAGNRIVAQKQVQIYDRLVAQGLSYFNTTETSDLLLRVTQTAQMGRAVIDTLVTGYVRDALTLVALVALMIYQQPLLSTVCLIVGPASLFLVQKILARVRDVMQQEMAGLTEIIKVVQETSIGVRVIKAFGLEPVMSSRMETAVRQVERRANKMIRLEAATTPIMDTLVGVAIGGVVLMSTVTIFGHSAGTPGQLISFVTAFLMAYEPAKRLSKMAVALEANMFGVRLMFEMLDAPPSMVEAKDAVDLGTGPALIQMRDVEFAYATGDAVLNGVTLDFPQGKTTALVGPSGGGKSTMLNLLLRLYDPTSGCVLINGQDIKMASYASLRKSIAFVGQDTFLFSQSIFQNLRLARADASDAQIFDAAKMAHADEFIQKLPLGYDTQIGENGVFLSGGQRQRLAIARAVLRQAPILLLDEATSALDSHSEKLVRDALEHLTKDVTTVVVAHRLSTILKADQICYLEAGKVLERGTLAELLSADGKFKRLYDSQFAGT